MKKLALALVLVSLAPAARAKDPLDEESGTESWGNEAKERRADQRRALREQESREALNHEIDQWEDSVDLAKREYRRWVDERRETEDVNARWRGRIRTWRAPSAPRQPARGGGDNWLDSETRRLETSAPASPGRHPVAPTPGPRAPAAGDLPPPPPSLDDNGPPRRRKGDVDDDLAARRRAADEAADRAAQESAQRDAERRAQDDQARRDAAAAQQRADAERRAREEQDRQAAAQQAKIADEERRRAEAAQKQKDAEQAKKIGGKIDDSGQFVDPDLP